MYNKTHDNLYVMMITLTRYARSTLPVDSIMWLSQSDWEEGRQRRVGRGDDREKIGFTWGDSSRTGRGQDPQSVHPHRFDGTHGRRLPRCRVCILNIYFEGDDSNNAEHRGSS